MAFNAVIFDFDGLILDTESSGVQAWQMVYRQYDVPFPLDRWLQNVGSHDVFDPAEYLENAVGRLLDRPQLYEEMRRHDHDLIHSRRPMVGVVDRLTEARNLGLKRAVASSSSARWVNYHLPRLGLLFEFDAVRTRSDVNDRHKPDPAVYLAACDALGIAPQNAFALEDSLNGVLSAKRAGMKVVAVPNEVTQSLDFSPADLVLSSLSEMTLQEMMVRLNDNT